MFRLHRKLFFQHHFFSLWVVYHHFVAQGQRQANIPSNKIEDLKIGKRLKICRSSIFASTSRFKWKNIFKITGTFFTESFAQHWKFSISSRFVFIWFTQNAKHKSNLFVCYLRQRQLQSSLWPVSKPVYQGYKCQWYCSFDESRQLCIKKYYYVVSTTHLSSN